MNNMDCKAFTSELPDLVLTPNARPSLAAVAHMRSCPPCAEEYLSFQATFEALDAWHAPEPTAYFDQKLTVMIREEQRAPKMSFWEAFRTRLELNTGSNFRPMLAGALGLALVIGGGGIAGINYSNVSVPAPQPAASATVNDLQILDRNEQAFQQLDELQNADDNSTQGSQEAPVAPPAS